MYFVLLAPKFIEYKSETYDKISINVRVRTV